MKAFEWANAATVDEAVKLLMADAGADPDEIPRPMGGGQDLLTTMKSYITRPPRVVNLKTIHDTGKISPISANGSVTGLVIDALVTLSQLEADQNVARLFPGLVEAAHSVATPQIRHLGTVGGNLNQRPRCWYYRNDSLTCLKKGGDTCYAIDGENKYHAIFGGDPCVIVHPSDLSPMLVALGATLSISGPGGKRDLPIEKFFVLPKDDVRHENVLKPGEIVTQIMVPASSAKTTYVKFKERASLDFAMSSVAAAVDLNADQTVKTARLVLGGVAPMPWALPKVNEYLTGKKLDDDTIKKAGELAVEGASPLEHNGYKVPLTSALVRRALAKLTV